MNTDQDASAAPRAASEDDAAEVTRAYAEALVNAAEKGTEAEAVLSKEQLSREVAIHRIRDALAKVGLTGVASP